MEPSVATLLLNINAQFYSTFGEAFAATRRRIQPGIRQLLKRIPTQGNWLDLGCGSGALAAEWASQGRRGAYIGLDFSSTLLDEARKTIAACTPPGLALEFYAASLADPHWEAALPPLAFDGVMSFAALHHLPGAALRRSILQKVRALLPAGGWFIHSEWQFQHSEKLMARRHAWNEVGLTENDLEPGDTLLDWRYALPGQAEQTCLRYVHLFDRHELAELAAGSQFKISDEFESDGEGGRLGLYQIWQAI
jgi:tRNA (uracil-5-)-methyltransferase TRM9